MHAHTTESPTVLRIVRRYAAPPTKVFDALTKPELLSQWFAPSEEFEVVVDRFQAERGGSYRIEMRHEAGEVHTCIGTIQEIISPKRLSYTWKWEGGEMGDTLVTWELQPTDDGTELTLTHDRFPNEEAKVHHEKGWLGIMSRLGSVL